MNRRSTVRTEASVTVTTPVSGAPKRRKPRVTARNSEVVVTQAARKDVLAAAQAALRPGERIVIISETRIDIVNN